MKKVAIFLTILSVFCSLCFPSLCEAVTVTIEVKPEFNENKKPELQTTFDFKIEVDVILEPNESMQYYTVGVSLTPSNFKGTAANAGDSLENDLYFDAEDNGEWTSVTPTTLGFSYNSQNTTLPGGFKVRCRDYGAHGDVRATVSYGTATYSGKKGKGHVPIDVNDNDIADGWEKEHGIYVADAEKAQAKAGDDDERGPLANQNHGDGWSVYDEYRGLYTTDVNGTPNGHIRLNPTIKEVIYCLNQNISEHGTGSLPGIPIHSFLKIDSNLVKEAFTSVYEDDPNDWQGSKLGKDAVDDIVGRVNFNSTAVPGYTPVWAIRMEVGRNLEFNEEEEKIVGYTCKGSPSKYSLVRILTKRIDDTVDAAYADAKGHFEKEENVEKFGDYLNEDGIWEKGTPEKIAAAKKYATSNVIAHELLHSINVSHCTHPGCFMDDDKIQLVLPSGDFSLIQRNADGSVKLDENNIPKKGSFHFDEDHYLELAVTGIPANQIEKHVWNTASLDDNGEEEAHNEDPEGSPMYSLVSSDGIYTATAGDGHEANFTTTQAYSSVYWYVRSPSESGYGTNVETDYGDSSTTTTAQMSYSFPTGVSGDYTITAYVYDTGGASVYQTSYTVSVSLPSSTEPEVPAAPAAPPPFSPVFSVDSTSTRYSAGDTFTGTVTATVPVSGCNLYASPPGSASDVYYIYFSWGGAYDNTVSVSFTFPENEPLGDWTFWLEASPWSDPNTSVTSQTYTVTVE